MMSSTPTHRCFSIATASACFATLCLWLAVFASPKAKATQPAGAYVAARQGWLYVAVSDFNLKSGQIAVVDPTRGVVDSISTGITPDVSVSPDGRRLYVTSTRMNQDGRSSTNALEIRDTQSGALLASVDDTDPFDGTGAPYYSRMAVSPDGSMLFIGKRRYSADGGSVFYVEGFDIEQAAMLPYTATLNACRVIALLPAGARQVYVLCGDSNDVLRVDMTSQQAAIDPNPARLDPSAGRRGVSALAMAFVSPDGSSLTAVGQDGRFAVADAPLLNVARAGAVDMVARRAAINSAAAARQPRAPQQPDADWLKQRQAWVSTGLVSPDGSRVYMTMGQLYQDGTWANRIVALDANSLTRLQTIDTDARFWTLSISHDGKSLYTINAADASIGVIDVASGNRIKSIPGVGPNPMFAVVAP